MKKVLLAICNLLIMSIYAHNKLPDSIQEKINKANQNDLAKIYNECASSLLDIDNSHAQELATKALDIANDQNNLEEINNAKTNLGIVFYKKDQYKKTIEYLDPLISYYKDQNSEADLATIYHYLGGANYFVGNYKRAHELFFKALEYNIKIKNLKLVGDLYGNISSVYQHMGDTVKAMEYAVKSLEVCKEVDNITCLGTAYHNLANIYFEREEYLKTIEFNLKSLELNKEEGDITGVATSYNNIAGVYFKIEDYNNAMRYYEKALQVYDSLNDLRNISMVKGNIGFTIECMGSPRKALDYYKESYEIAKEIAFTSQILFTIESFAVIYDSIGMHELAYNYLDTLRLLEDSFFNEEKYKQIAELEAKYQSNEKENKIKLLSKDAKINEEKLKRRNLLVVSFGGALALLIFLIFFIWRSYMLKKKSNQLLRQQNWEILEKNEELQQQREEILAQREEIELKSDYLQKAYETIEHKNKNITDSIRYAKKIQNALLTNKEKIESIFRDSFIFHLAKDIVSGDFYWVTKIEDNIVIAAIDCTGHGVPGAFMSIVANNLLNQTIIQENTLETNEILNKLNIGLNKTLHSSNDKERIKDGMDIAICKIDTKSKTISYSGAYNSAYLIRKAKNKEAFQNVSKLKVHDNDKVDTILIELLPDKHPVGKYFADDFKSFTSVEIKYEPEDCLYLFSDGFADQFGGIHNRKFMYNRFRNLLIDNYLMPAKEQKRELENNFNNWKSKYDQIDDVLVIGLKLDI